MIVSPIGPPRHPGRPYDVTVSRAVVWFRNDLRLEANPAFASATSHHDEVVAAVTLDERLLAGAGPFRRAMFLANVDSLAKDLAALGGHLHILDGPPVDAMSALISDHKIDSLYVNHAASTVGQSRVRGVLNRTGVEAFEPWGTLVTEPGSVLTLRGTLSRVFTPFFKKWSTTPLPTIDPGGDATLVRLPAITDATLRFDTPPIPAGNNAAHERLSAWLEQVDSYDETRDFPAIPGTSALSADLRFGTISPRTVLDTVGTSTPGRSNFVRQLSWRDWYAHLLFETPTLTTHAVRPEYDNIAWRDDATELEAWKQGRTGYPIVDAGMRQLAQTGWMHNRVRMITGSFLVKDLLTDWRHGEKWFRRMLIDGEPSQNAGNWQWVAGTGTDAAPYFRIFNPITQSRKFDANGEYIRRWVPELCALDAKAIHAPWEVGPLELAASGVVLGDTYPGPIIDHGFARDRTLAAYKAALGT